MEERPRPRMETCSVKRMPGCNLLSLLFLLVSLVEEEEGGCTVARGTKLFHWGQVEVSRREERMREGEAAMVVVARTVKAGEDWAPQWGVGRGGMRADVTVGWFGRGGGGDILVKERTLWVRDVKEDD